MAAQKMIQLSPGADPVLADQVEAKSTEEGWVTVTLSDGTTVRAKPVLADVWRIRDRYDPQGNPLYWCSWLTVSTVTSPEELRKK